MTEACCCDFPVNLQKARRAFAKALAEINRADEEFGPYLDERDAAIEASLPRESFWRAPRQRGILLGQKHRYLELSAMAANVTSLRLTRSELTFMQVAIEGAIYDRWAARVKEFRSEPFPEPRKEPRPGSWIELKLAPRKSLLQTLWDAL